MRTLRRLGVLVVAGLLGLGPGLVLHGTAQAAGVTWYVNGTTGTDPSPAGSCPTASTSPFKTIGAALACAANDHTSASSPDTISIAAGTYGERLTVNANVNLVGVAGQTIVDGGGSGSVVTVNCCTVGISNLTIQHGSVPGSGAAGGGIFNLGGRLTLSNSTVSNNSAGDRGGGIFNEGTLSLSNSSVSNNSANIGGGIDTESGTLTLSSSTVSNNTASEGGGIANDGSTLNVSNSAVSNNSANIGGGIVNGDTLTLTNSAVKGNTATSGQGSGIFNLQGTVTLPNSTVSKNTPPQDQCHGC